MVPQEFSATIIRGVDFCFGIVLGETVDYANIQSPDAYVDLTDWEFTVKLYSKTGAELVTLATEFSYPYVLNISLTAEQTSALSAQFGARMPIITRRPNEDRLEELVVGRISIANP